jgi:AAA domain-containing protein
MTDLTPETQDFTAADSWTPAKDGTCRSGDLRLSIADDDPTRWVLDNATTGRPLLSGQVPHSGYSTIGLLAVLDYHLAEFDIGVTGLDAWCAGVEDRALAAYVDLEDREREERERPQFPGRLASDLTGEALAEIDWLVPGFVAPGWTVKVAAREKVGKGTLALYVIGRLERGEDTCFGPTPRAATALILTEEPQESMVEKLRLFGVTRARVVAGWELASRSWPEKVAALVEVAVAEGHGLVFVDNVSRAAGIEDEAGTELARAIEELQDRCRANRIAAWIDHHHKKGSGRDEDKSRGSTSISGAADINVDLFPKHGRVRRVTSLGRVRATTWEKLIELNEDGTDYALVADGEADDEARAEADALADLTMLRGRREVTISEFERATGASKSAARRRLQALVDDGKAVVARPGENGNESRANVYRPAPFVPSGDAE